MNTPLLVVTIKDSTHSKCYTSSPHSAASSTSLSPCAVHYYDAYSFSIALPALCCCLFVSSCAVHVQEAFPRGSFLHDDSSCVVCF